MNDVILVWTKTNTEETHEKSQVKRSENGNESHLQSKARPLLVRIKAGTTGATFSVASSNDQDWQNSKCVNANAPDVSAGQHAEVFSCCVTQCPIF